MSLTINHSNRHETKQPIMVVFSLVFDGVSNWFETMSMIIEGLRKIEPVSRLKFDTLNDDYAFMCGKINFPVSRLKFDTLNDDYGCVLTHNFGGCQHFL